MTTDEFYFLILACGSFVSLGICLAVATIIYHRSLGQPAKAPSRR